MPDRFRRCPITVLQPASTTPENGEGEANRHSSESQNPVPTGGTPVPCLLLRYHRQDAGAIAFFITAIP